MKNVAILGASSKEDRYAFKAQKMLMDHGYPVYPISIRDETILDVQCFKTMGEITDSIDTLTLYVGAARLEPIIDDILALSPRRVIFNPGTESDVVKSALDAAGIVTLEACTLVLLSTSQFEIN